MRCIKCIKIWDSHFKGEIFTFEAYNAIRCEMDIDDFSIHKILKCIAPPELVTTYTDLYPETVKKKLKKNRKVN